MAPAWLSVPSAAALSLLDGRRPREWEWLPLRTACPSGGRRVRVPCRRPRTTGFSVAAQRRLVVAAAAMEMTPAAGEKEADAPFTEEMRAAAMRLHSRDQARDGKKEAPLEPPVAKWQTTVEGYLRFLVDSKLVFQTLEAIVDRAVVPWCECSAVLLFSSVSFRTVQRCCVRAC
jgi:heme oxygenase (biliverdin-producing, ferredoxin)